MPLAREMAAVAAECIRTPSKLSIWSNRLGRYVCQDDPEFQSTLAEHRPDTPSPINPVFKLVFVTALGGTVFFIAVCVALTMLHRDGPMPDAASKLVTGLFDMAKIGFGSIVGLLGGQTLKLDTASKKKP